VEGTGQAASRAQVSGEAMVPIGDRAEGTGQGCRGGKRATARVAPTIDEFTHEVRVYYSSDEPCGVLVGQLPLIHNN